MFFTLITQPLFNFLIFLYNLSESIIFTADFGIAIVLFTIILKWALFPLTKKQQKFQEQQQIVSPKLKEIQKKYKDEPQKLQKEQLKLMKEHKFNPAAGCLPIIIQIIIFITFYWILNPGNMLFIENGSFTVKGDALYSFISNPGEINKYFIGLVDLTKPNVILAFLTAIVQFLHSRMMTAFAAKKKEKQDKGKGKEEKNQEPSIEDVMAKQMKFMNYVFPIMIFYIGFTVSAGLPLYWLTSSLIGIIQHKIVAKQKKDDKK